MSLPVLGQLSALCIEKDDEKEKILGIIERGEKYFDYVPRSDPNVPSPYMLFPTSVSQNFKTEDLCMEFNKYGCCKFMPLKERETKYLLLDYFLVSFATKAKQNLEQRFNVTLDSVEVTFLSLFFFFWRFLVIAISQLFFRITPIHVFFLRTSFFKKFVGN